MRRFDRYGGSAFDSLGHRLFTDSRYRDEDGRPVERTPLTHPYSYSTFVEYQNPRIHRNDADGDAYDDRMREWDYKKHEKAMEDTREAIKSKYIDFKNPRHVEIYLRFYWEDPELTLVTILHGCNQASGYPVFYFRWQTGKKQKALKAGKAATE